MKNNEFTKLINKTQEASNLHFKLMDKINEESIKRHGFDPSQVDCDDLIDKLLYGGGADTTAKEFDEAMKDAIKSITDCNGNVITNN